MLKKGSGRMEENLSLSGICHSVVDYINIIYKQAAHSSKLPTSQHWTYSRKSVETFKKSQILNVQAAVHIFFVISFEAVLYNINPDLEIKNW